MNYLKEKIQFSTTKQSTTKREHENYHLCPLGVNRTNIWIWPNNPVKKGYIFRILRFFIKLQVDYIFSKLSISLWTKATQGFWRTRHFLLANEKPFIVSLSILSSQLICSRRNKNFDKKINKTNLEALPWQSTTEKKYECISKRLQIISPATSSS